MWREDVRGEVCLSPLLLLLCQRECQVAFGSGEGGRGREDELLRLRVVALRRQADPNAEHHMNG